MPTVAITNDSFAEFELPTSPGLPFNESCIQGFAKFSGSLPANGESGLRRDNTRARV